MVSLIGQKILDNFERAARAESSNSLVHVDAHFLLLTIILLYQYLKMWIEYRLLKTNKKRSLLLDSIFECHGKITCLKLKLLSKTHRHRVL